MESQQPLKKEFSFELFPGRTPDAFAKLEKTLSNLAVLKPDYFSVTFGAGGSTREATLLTVENIRKKTNVEVVPHISCIGMSRQDISDILALYRAVGVSKLVVIRGDLPAGYNSSHGDFLYASELVSFIRHETGDEFNIHVAAYPDVHPRSKTVSADLENFKRKVDAGANGAITQYFYNPDAYFRFVDSCEKLGIDIPIVPGIMPITNCEQLARFSKGCGADIPSWIAKRLQELEGDQVAIREFGIDVVASMCNNLLTAGAPGIHIFTMNGYVAPQAIWDNFNLER